MTGEFWQGILQNFWSDAASALIYLAIAALFVASLVKCTAPVINIRRVLKSAIRAIKAGESSKRSWQDEKFLGKGALYPHWSEYLNNLFFADGEFHNPSNVEDYINEDTAIYGPGRATFSEVVPGLMVSLGFLGTLIGLSMGLKNFDMSNADSVMTGIQTLVPGMRYAFNTSIAGVCASIALSLITRIVNGAAQRTLSNFYAAMNKYAGVVSVDPMTQIAIYQQEQTSLIQRIAEDMAGAMTNRVGLSIERAVKPMQKTMDDFVNTATREQMRTMDTLVTRFIDALNNSVDNQFKHIAYTIDMTCRNQQQMLEDIHKAMDGLSKLSRDMADAQEISGGVLKQFEGYLDKLNEVGRQADDGYARLAANAEHLEIVAMQQNNYLQSVNQMQSEIGKALEGFQKSNENFQRVFAGNVDAATAAMEQVVKEMEKAGQVLSGGQQALVNGVNKDIDRTYNAFFAHIGETSERLAWMVEDVKNTMAKLPEVLDGAAGLYANQGDRMLDALRRAQDALDVAVDRLTRAGYR